ncbi:MAG: FtsQ-type POTRA domain-containing protein [Alphaproteobacteria bacterium]|nr:FtsQ-type POTRA domain-containing protein [Alphaproteobacteria bacterium]NDC55728.1 FtsQ-type POTRA domain-containing protein [Alphaproteobacteria bacterium]NDG04059.1 FtsQ-type POTRA domain-containing protein [Alphaproteobacteria bacterium]
MGKKPHKRSKRSQQGLHRHVFWAALVVLVLSGSYLAIHFSGWRPQMPSIMPWLVAETARKGMRADHVLVGGRRLTPPDHISAALAMTKNTPLLGLNLLEIQTRLQQLPWVQSAHVRRQWPDTLVVTLHERIPAARWRGADQTIVLIDQQGDVIPTINGAPFTQLPLMVGDGASSQVGRLMKAWRQFPALRDQLAEAHWVGGRRFDLILKNHLTLKLPEGDISIILPQVAQLIAEHDLLSRSLRTIDLRVEGRMVLEKIPPTPVSTATTTSLVRQPPSSDKVSTP